MNAPFVRRETVRWVDLDAQGVVNNSVFLTWFEQARLGYFQLLGCLRGDAFPFLLGETSIRFERPGRLGMEPHVQARVTRLGDRSFDMVYAVEAGGERLATGTATLVWVDGSMRSMRIPDPVRDAIAAREAIPREASR